MPKTPLDCLPQTARDDLKVMLRSRDTLDHDALTHFYVMGYQQCEIERMQKVIRDFNQDRKLRNERIRKI